MRYLNYIRVAIFLLSISCWLDHCFAQSDVSGVSGHAGASNTAYYVGWDNSTTFDLNIIHNAVGKNINFTTTTSGSGTTQKATILANGNVGIGTATPISLLHVNTALNANVFTQITNSASTTGLLLGVAGTSGNGVINMHDNKALNFYTHNAVRLHIDDDNTTNRGYVGIGNGFLLPTCRLHINETGVNNDGWLQITTANTGSTSINGLRIGITDANKEVILNQQEAAAMRLKTSATERVTILGDGRVGIGVTSPMELFHVKSTVGVPGYSTLVENANTGVTPGSYIALHATSTFSRIGSQNSTTNIAAFFEANGGRTANLGLDVDAIGTNGITQFASGGNFEGHGGVEVRGLLALGENGDLFNYGVKAEAKSANTAATNIGISAGASGSGGTGGIHKAGNFIATNGATNYGVDALASQSGATTNYGVNSLAENATTTNYGINAEAGHGVTGYGVNGWSHDATTEGFGVKGFASGTGGATNYGVYGVAQNGTKNYGVYGVAAQNSPGCIPGSTCSDAAGYFAGDLVWTGNSFKVSDKSFKQNIVPLTNSLAIIKKLQPKKFEYKTQQYPSMNLPDGLQYGLIGENVDTVLPTLTKTFIHPATYDVSGNLIDSEVVYTGVDYVSMIPILLAALKAEQIRIDSLVDVIGNSSRPANGESAPESMQRVNLSSQSEAILYQNEPNPFSNQTKIRYFIPESAGKAVMTFYDNTGKPIKESAIAEKGYGTVEVDGSNLGNDIYTYSLAIDGKMIDTKRMVKTK